MNHEKEEIECEFLYSIMKEEKETTQKPLYVLTMTSSFCAIFANNVERNR